MREKAVVYWSKSFYNRERHEHQSLLDFVEKLRANPTGFRMTAEQSRSLRRFMKKDVLNRKSGLSNVRSVLLKHKLLDREARDCRTHGPQRGAGLLLLRLERVPPRQHPLEQINAMTVKVTPGRGAPD